MKNLFIFFVLLSFMTSLILSGGVGGCGDTEGEGSEAEEEVEPATLENLDQGFFSCTGRTADDASCDYEGLFGGGARSQRSFFYFLKEGAALRVYDEDTSLVGTLDGNEVNLSSGEFASYIPIPFDADGVDGPDGTCRLLVNDATYHLSLTSKDLFTVSLQGTITDGSTSLAPCEQNYLNLSLPPGGCVHKATLTCRRVLEDGLTLDEILDRQADAQSHWDQQVAQGKLIPP